MSEHYVVSFENASAMRASLPGNVYFALSDTPSDPPADLVFRRPRFLAGEYEGYPCVALEGRILAPAEVVGGSVAYVVSSLPREGHTLRLYHEARVASDGRFRACVHPAEAWGLTLRNALGVDILETSWKPTGANPEVREFTLPP